MKLQRTLAYGLRLAGTIAQAVAEHAWLSRKGRLSLQSRADWLHRWCAICLPRLEVEYRWKGAPPGSTLLVSNHLSYLDVLVLSAITPCVFVAKKEVARWPVFGWMALLSGTVFVDRNRRTDVHRASTQISEAASAGVLVVVFPEGTSTDGKTVLPFRSSLLEPAVRLQLPITPAHISYSLEDGSAESEICYWGDMTLIPHLANLLSKRGIRAAVSFGESLVYDNRKQAAMETHREVLRMANLPELELSAP